MSDVGCGWDFLDWVGPDLAASAFGLLDHPADLVRAAAVSRSWRRCAVESGVCKSLCVKLCPEAAVFTSAVEVSRSPPTAAESSSGGGSGGREDDARSQESQFRIFSCLCGAVLHSTTKPDADCIQNCFGASSTDNFPDESMDSTLQPQDRINLNPSYWSSGGQDDPDVPESLTYKLASDICVVREIKLQPFKAYFQIGFPIYSPKMVRFRFGHCKLPHGTESYLTDEDENLAMIADENYVWTYTSPEFPVLQENMLQSFRLPRPVLCIGGVVKIELLGRVQKQATDDKYYICVCHAQVVGRSLSPVFVVDIADAGGHAVLKYSPGVRNLGAEDVKQEDARDSTDWHSLVARYRQVRHLAIMNVLLGPPQSMEEDDAGVVSDDDPFE
ncbi:F-box protein At4g00755 [Brachypodium distachyon]|uniref:F-box domain-containing protein n=1 Tax=Brachypodium distachyon TaxID=15368 RepID=I1HAI0_BRADI|nr:F-box protein At4g00755 [Brachypodium distachyon]KQK23987.1 hypothetical protein BRADI_1g77420v3 [Brachypodium distachyon]|eukprot:XP_003558968.1 F-box protein At4g00755 [Brachypodium distachyon]